MHFKYNSQSSALLNDLSISADSGCLIVLTRKSGSGKSTLLRLIAGLMSPLMGRITIEGENVSGKFCRRIKTVGFVSQNPQNSSLSKVGQELAFAMESACFNQEYMRSRLVLLLIKSRCFVGSFNNCAFWW